MCVNDSNCKEEKNWEKETAQAKERKRQIETKSTLNCNFISNHFSKYVTSDLSEIYALQKHFNCDAFGEILVLNNEN